MNDFRSLAFRIRLAPIVRACLAATVLGPAVAAAQDTDALGLALKPSLRLAEAMPADARSGLPTFVSGERMEGQVDREAVVEGAAELRRSGMVIRADRLEYNQADAMARARGHVRVNRAGNVFEGPLLEINVDTYEGFFSQPSYRFLRNNAYGEADRVDFLDDKRAIIRNASYTTCQRRPGPDWMPDWILRAATISLDDEQEVGRATGGLLTFKGIPVLPMPSASFPLSDRRKSGVLPPTIGLGSVNGAELTLPFYWDIAPNRDATFFPTVMSKRGVDLGAEFRYLEPRYNGTTRVDYLPGDRLRDRDRWAYAVRHTQNGDLGDLSGVGFNLNLNRVSDDNYWRDFSRTSPSLTQRLLANEGIAAWSGGPFSVMARALKWQTLQDPTAPIVPPYDRLPQVIGHYAQEQLPGGLAASLDADFTRFEADRLLTGQPNARRSYALAQLRWPWQMPGAFFTPKLQLHATHYSFDQPLATGADRANRTVPTASVDTGLIFERQASFFGRAFVQTLEPRAFYVYTPHRAQNFLPNYDSAANDFNFATIYTENAFGGNDRIADNNLLTLGATTRLIDPATGAEAARFGIAQRLRFADQLVTLPGEPPVSERLSDILLGAALNWTPRWSVDSTVQYNPKTRRSIRSTVGLRYSPGAYRSVSAAYRLQRGLSEQVDVGWQWPLNDLWGDRGLALAPGRGEGEGRWYSVGRLNFSLKDRRVVDTVAGLEYDAGCWLARVVLERLQSSVNSSSKRVLFQMEFVGFTRLGSNALQSLRENVPRYQFLREEVSLPSRFSNYD